MCEIAQGTLVLRVKSGRSWGVCWHCRPTTMILTVCERNRVCVGGTACVRILSVEWHFKKPVTSAAFLYCTTAYGQEMLRNTRSEISMPNLTVTKQISSIITIRIFTLTLHQYHTHTFLFDEVSWCGGWGVVPEQDEDTRTIVFIQHCGTLQRRGGARFVSWKQWIENTTLS